MRCLFIICCLIIFSNCNPCGKYENEVYYKDSFQRYLRSDMKDKVREIMAGYREPDLSNLDYESYRLSFSSTFKGDTSHIIRVGKKEGHINLIHKLLTDSSDSTKTVIKKSEIIISEKEWKRIIDVIYENNYWTLPKEIEREGLDGSVWFFEGRRPDAEVCGKRSNHIVRRWSPEEGNFSRIVHELIILIDL